MRLWLFFRYSEYRHISRDPQRTEWTRVVISMESKTEGVEKWSLQYRWLELSSLLFFSLIRRLKEWKENKYIQAIGDFNSTFKHGMRHVKATFFTSFEEGEAWALNLNMHQPGSDCFSMWIYTNKQRSAHNRTNSPTSNTPQPWGPLLPQN